MPTRRRSRTQQQAEGSPTIAPRILRDVGRALQAHNITPDQIAIRGEFGEEQIKQALAGSVPIAEADALSRRLCYLLACAALKSSELETRDRLLAVARRLGDRAFLAGYEDAEIAFAQSATGAAAGELLPPGFHVAPFLSTRKNLMLVAIREDSRCGCVGEVAEISGQARADGAPENTWDNPIWTPPEWVNASGCFSSFDLYSHELLEEGVHVARWLPWKWLEGCCLLAIDRHHRLVARTDVRNRKDGKAVRVALSDAPSSDLPWDDNSKDDTDDEDFTRGDEWKKQ
jgi:hypothetical protein